MLAQNFVQKMLVTERDRVDKGNCSYLLTIVFRIVYQQSSMLLEKSILKH